MATKEAKADQSGVPDCTPSTTGDIFDQAAARRKAGGVESPHPVFRPYPDGGLAGAGTFCESDPAPDPTDIRVGETDIEHAG